MADTKISALSAQTTPTGSEIMLGVDGGANVKITTNQVRNFCNELMVPTYISGNWYLGHFGGPTSTNSGGGSASTTYYYPFPVWQSVTVSDLGCRVQTLAVGNTQLAIFANDNSTMKPTGAVLGKTGNIDTSTTGVKTAVLSGGNITLSPGVYWLGVSSDNTTSRFLGTSVIYPFQHLVGAVTQANSNGAASSRSGWSMSESFGTWGTPASLSETTVGGLFAFFKVA